MCAENFWRLLSYEHWNKEHIDIGRCTVSIWILKKILFNHLLTSFAWRFWQNRAPGPWEDAANMCSMRGAGRQQVLNGWPTWKGLPSLPASTRNSCGVKLANAFTFKFTDFPQALASQTRRSFSEGFLKLDIILISCRQHSGLCKLHHKLMNLWRFWSHSPGRRPQCLGVMLFLRIYSYMERLFRRLPFLSATLIWPKFHLPHFM